jgi:hypothetical protein
MLTRILAVAAALLAALVIHQYNQIGQLNAQIADMQAQAVTRARAVVADSMEGTGAEVQRTLSWLNDFYKSPDGLQRKDGLWLGNRPDWEGISVWVFDVYLRNRLKGLTEEQARQAIEKQIKGSDEWKQKHRTQS